jgi:hypothetical protein
MTEPPIKKEQHTVFHQKVSESLNKVHAVLGSEFQPGFFTWLDARKEDEFEHIRFLLDTGLNLAHERQDETLLEAVVFGYQSSILNLMREFGAMKSREQESYLFKTYNLIGDQITFEDME